MLNKKWDMIFLDMAKKVSELSKDPSTKVGSVIADPSRRIVSLGYNGFPRNINDSKERYENRDIKYRYIVHAEANAILNAKVPVEGYCIYVYPIPPCNECSKLIIQSGLKRVVSFDNIPDRWKEHMELALDMLQEAGIDVILYKMEEEKK